MELVGLRCFPAHALILTKAQRMFLLLGPRLTKKFRPLTPIDFTGLSHLNAFEGLALHDLICLRDGIYGAECIKKKKTSCLPRRSEAWTHEREKRLSRLVK